MNNFELFNQLLRAETESAVDLVLVKAGYLEDEGVWQPLGFENNFAAISNQQSDPSGALARQSKSNSDRRPAL